MKILFVSLGKFEEGLKNLISDQLKVDILIAKDFEEAHTYIDNVELKVIISGFEAEGDKSHRFFEYYNSIKKEVPFFWFTDAPHMEVVPERFYEINKQNQFFTPDDNSDTLIDSIKEIVSSGGDSKGAIKYSKIGLKRLYKFEKVNVDLYIKLSETKLIKIINADEIYDHEKLKKYEAKEIKYLYTTVEDYELLSDYMYSQLKNSLTQNVSGKDQMVSQSEGAAFIQGMVKNFKVDEKTIAIVNEVTKSCMQTASKSPALKIFFDNLSKEKDGYLYNHSTMISYLASMVSGILELSTESSSQKLATAALLHDAGLDDEVSARIETLEQLKNSSLTPNQQRKVKMHMITVSERLKTVDSILPDVDNIILCHHEKPDGSGFPRSLTASQIPPLGAVFIITEAFVSEVFGKDINIEICKKALTKMESLYSQGNFKASFDAFKVMIETNMG